MASQIIEIGLYSLLPSVCMLVGGSFASFYLPGPRLTSATQHFAAGVVFAGVAKELLPKVGGAHTPLLPLFIGFSLGILLMLGIKSFTEQLAENTKEIKQIPWSLIFAVGIDLLIDGILIGVAFLAGEQGGILIAIALAIEILFLGLSTSASLGNAAVPATARLLITIGLACITPLGALLGASVFMHSPISITDSVLAFGIAALLYLVTEELLLEAHEVKETPWITASFFLGFLVILLLET